MKPRIVLSIEDLPSLTDEQLAAVRGGGDVGAPPNPPPVEPPVDNGIGTSPSFDDPNT